MAHEVSQIVAGLGRLALHWRAAGWRDAAARGLNPTQAEILARLARRGPERAGELAAALGVTSASLSDSVSSLAAKGLVERRPDPEDGRAVRAALTAAGRAAAADLPEAPAALAAAVKTLPETERAALLRALTRIIRALQEARAIPVQRMCATCRHFRPFAHDDADAPHHCAFVDAAFGEAALRLDCGEHEEAPEEERARAWARFAAAG